MILTIRDPFFLHLHLHFVELFAWSHVLATMTKLSLHYRKILPPQEKGEGRRKDSR
jgi:hypothetical protein